MKKLCALVMVVGVSSLAAASGQAAGMRGTATDGKQGYAAPSSQKEPGHFGKPRPKPHPKPGPLPGKGDKLAQYGHSYFPNYLQHLTPAQIQTLLVQSPGSAVVSFAEQHLGQKVWSPNWSHNMMGAQCTDLVDAALQSAGAKTFNQFSQPSDPNGDYVWGNLALKQSYSNGHLTLSSGQYSDIAAGDILQFRNVRLNNPDGSWSTDAHHTAIVEKNLGNGRLQILQQNSNNQHFVTRAVISINAMTQADPNAGPAALWVYHPVPR